MMRILYIFFLTLALSVSHSYKAQNYLDFQASAFYDVTYMTVDAFAGIEYFSFFQEVYYSGINSEGIDIYYAYTSESIVLFSNEPPEYELFLYVDSITGTLRATPLNYMDSLYVKYATLYDYSQQVGDTVNSDMLNMYVTSPFVINSIDTLNYNGIDRRTFHCSNNAYDSYLIIEGIGTDKGLFVNQVEEFESSHDLKCAIFDTVLIYGGSACFYGIEEKGKSSTVSIYPNPSEGLFTLGLNEQNIDAENSFYSVTTISGKVILNGPLFNNKQGLNLTSFDAGMYFLQVVINGKQKISKKLILK